MKAANKIEDALAELADQNYCYLTTTGRVSEKDHEIEIWFAVEGETIYHMAGGRYDPDWVKNSLKNPDVRERIGEHNFSGRARLVEDKDEETKVRRMLAGKYQGWKEGQALSDWASTALPVAVDILEAD